MKRAIQTAEPFAAIAALEIEIHPGVAEFDQDASTYVPMEELKREDYERWREFVAGGYAETLDIGAFRPLDAFHADMERLVDRLKSAPLAAGSEEIRYPGELEALADRRHRRTGVVLPADTLAELDTAAADLGIATLSSIAW